MLIILNSDIKLWEESDTFHSGKTSVLEHYVDLAFMWVQLFWLFFSLLGYHESND